MTAERKSIPPNTQVEWVGTSFDSTDMTIGITQARKSELLVELNKWRFKKYTTRRELESLVGKLQFVSNCVRPGRLFVSRLLTEFKVMIRGKQYKLSEQARKDIKWW